MSAQMLEVSLLGVGTMLRLEEMCGQWSNNQGKPQMSTPSSPPSTVSGGPSRKGCVVNGQMTNNKASNKRMRPPPPPPPIVALFVRYNVLGKGRHRTSFQLAPT